MATQSLAQRLPLVVITGPTASGKTSLAIKLAKKFNGEIICADSRTIYRGMDIGTAKPTRDERRSVAHWGLDLVNPGDVFTAADFKNYAEQKIEEIRSRGRMPLLVGGTGLYIDSVIFDFQFGRTPDPDFRSRLENMSINQLRYYCKEHNIVPPENDKNKRYLVRAIEQNNSSKKRRKQPTKNTIVVGIATSINTLRSRIDDRAEQLFANGVVEEATMLGKKYGWESEAMTGNVYPLVNEFLRNRLDKAELMNKVALSDWHLAKRQMTWLRRNEYLLWADLESAEQYITAQLADESLV